MTFVRPAPLVLVAAMCLRPGPARAQSPVPPGTIDAAFGIAWAAAQPLGSGDAHETTPTGGAFRIFTASTTLASATAVEGRIGLRVTRHLELLASGSYGTPTLRISLSGDSENAAAVTATERIQQFTLGGGALWYIGRWRTGNRLAPFVTGEAAYLRQVHDGNTLIQTGREYQIGGGIKYPLVQRNRGRLKSIGVRVDVRAVLRTRGLAFDAGVHTSPSFGASSYVRF
jgi:hypothetical protein